MTKKRLMQLFLTAIIIGIVIIICVITPIFSRLSVWLLDDIAHQPRPQTPPQLIVLLGGGLTKNQQQTIILNHYSQSRADTANTLQQQSKLAILTSGVESPWLGDYLSKTNPNAVIIAENASMNTCENARFTAKLLAHHELPTSVYLITDAYHMARARRQFAQVGISTTPYAAPLAVGQNWLSPKTNLTHSRRALYEIVALIRDIYSPQDDCRTMDEISIEEISTPRRQPQIFF
ncbi:YdcF family protein [Moraxella sp.]|uniref:YdcF family protein n=1 Tax=Moraxella sp. TaxID=479 RepID=UPI0026DBAA31|nr:YdcF family protein [Moraxella sp.]MDO4894141.1 YdcF family protein [Moraxella sp.]